MIKIKNHKRESVQEARNKSKKKETVAKEQSDKVQAAVNTSNREKNDRKKEKKSKKKDDYDWKYVTKLNDFGADSHSVLQSRDEYDGNNPEETVDRYDEKDLPLEGKKNDRSEPEMDR